METLISLSRLQAANVSNLRDSGRTFHLPPMTIQADVRSSHMKSAEGYDSVIVTFIAQFQAPLTQLGG